MKLESRQELGQEIAKLVIEAEEKFGPGAGQKKMAWCVRQAQKRAPNGKSPSAEAARWFGGMVLRLAIEIAVAVLHEYQKRGN